VNKAELIDAIAAKTKQSKKDTEETLTVALDVIATSVLKGNKVQLKGFGTFEQVERAARNAKNPRTGAEIQVPAKKVARAKLSFGKEPKSAKA
jgi:DNA-binding protein HU-beta